jgi:hypothetical protein
MFSSQYIAKRLLEINERGTFVDPATLTSEDPKKNSRLLAQEEELFQTARLINCGWFGSVVFSDYFSCILGLVRQGSSWSLNPFGVSPNKLLHSKVAAFLPYFCYLGNKGERPLLVPAWGGKCLQC